MRHRSDAFHASPSAATLVRTIIADWADDTGITTSGVMQISAPSCEFQARCSGARLKPGHRRPHADVCVGSVAIVVVEPAL